MLSANALTTVVYCLSILGIMALRVRSPWLVPALIVLGTVNIVSLIAIWRWRVWGFYAALTSAVVIFIVNSIVGQRPFFAAVGLLGPLLLYAVMRPLWKHFK
jgi:hypothetical protein